MRMRGVYLWSATQQEAACAFGFVQGLILPQALSKQIACWGKQSSFLNRLRPDAEGQQSEEVSGGEIELLIELQQRGIDKASTSTTY